MNVFRNPHGLVNIILWAWENWFTLNKRLRPPSASSSAPCCVIWINLDCRQTSNLSLSLSVIGRSDLDLSTLHYTLYQLCLSRKKYTNWSDLDLRAPTTIHRSLPALLVRRKRFEWLSLPRGSLGLSDACYGHICGLIQEPKNGIIGGPQKWPNWMAT